METAKRLVFDTSVYISAIRGGLFSPVFRILQETLPRAFLASVVYTCVLRRTGTLRASIQVHILYNVLVSWPLLGRVLLARPAGDLESPATWAIPLACLAFVSIALPAYLWLARRDVRVDDAPPPAR